MEKKISYSAVVLDEASHKKILNSIPVPEGWKEYAHHCTICLGALPRTWGTLIGEKINITATTWGVDDSNKALAIKIDNFERLMEGTSHITVAVNFNNGGKPKDSNLITNWSNRLEHPLELTGVITEISF